MVCRCGMVPRDGMCSVRPTLCFMAPNRVVHHVWEADAVTANEVCASAHFMRCSALTLDAGAVDSWRSRSTLLSLDAAASDRAPLAWR